MAATFILDFWIFVRFCYRRLAKNYERLPESSEPTVQIAMIRLMLRRLAAQHESQKRRELRRKERLAARDGYALVA